MVEEDGRRHGDEKLSLSPDARTAFDRIRRDRANLQGKLAGERDSGKALKIREEVGRHIEAEQGLLGGNYDSAAGLLRQKAAEDRPGSTATFLAPFALGRLHVSSRKTRAQGMMDLADRLTAGKPSPRTPGH